MVNERKMRGITIAQAPNQVVRLDDRFYRVASQTGEGMYDVTRTRAFAIGWICNCPDFNYRKVKCKHIWAVQFSLKLRAVVQPQVIEPIEVDACVYCKSKAIVRDGQRHKKLTLILLHWRGVEKMTTGYSHWRGPNGVLDPHFYM